MTTIDNVAKHAGVSIKTVSRVINQEPYVTEATRTRVLKAMAELGYVANVSARRLASGRAGAIGFVYHNPSWQYITIALQGVLEKAREAGFETVIHPCDARDARSCEDILDLVRRRSVDGFIFTPPCDVATNVLAHLQTAGVPFVRITPQERTSPLAYVTADDRQGAFEMTHYLLGLGHRRIGFIMGDPDQIASHQRLEGYKDALAAHRLPVDEALLQAGDFSYRSGVRCAHALLQASQPPTAVFASNDDMAAGVLSVAHELGIPVPDHLSVAGFDNIDLAWQVYPTLTTVAQPIHDIAVGATEILVGMLRGEVTQTEHRTLNTRLIIRASTGVYPG